MARRSVVLPAPEGPTMPTNAPGWRTSETSSSTGRPLYAHVTWRSSTAGADALPFTWGTGGVYQGPTGAGRPIAAILTASHAASPAHRPPGRVARRAAGEA